MISRFHPPASPFRLSVLLLALVSSSIAPPDRVSAQTAASKPSPRKPTPADPAAIERRLIEATRREPPTVEALHALAAFYIEQGRIGSAIPYLKRAQDVDSSHYASGYDLAVALLETGKLDEARQQVARMLAAKETGELLNLLGDVEERAGNLTVAAEAYQRAAHKDATEEHLFDWGNNLIQLGAFAPATEVFTAAVARHPRSARLFVGLGISQYSRGQYDDAVKSFCRAADLAPDDWRPYGFLGEMYGVAPDPGGEVSARLARFVKAHPRHARANLYYALSLWKGRSGPLPAADARRVEALLRKAVTLDRTLVKGFLELGILLSDQRRDQEAIQDLRRAIQLQPDLAQAHYRLAQAYRRTGQAALAAKELEIFEQLEKRR